MLSNGVGEVSPVFYLQLFKCPPLKSIRKIDSWILIKEFVITLSSLKVITKINII